MGLFGPSKRDTLSQRIFDVEIIYERLVEVFRENIRLEEKSEFNRSSMQTFQVKTTVLGLPVSPKLGTIADIFNEYPTSLLGENVMDYTKLMRYANSIGSFKYRFPRSLPESPTKAKERIILKINKNARQDIQQVCSDFFVILNKAMNEINDVKNQYPDLHMQLAAMYYRARGAVAWYNHLDKKIVEY